MKTQHTLSVRKRIPGKVAPEGKLRNHMRNYMRNYK